MLEHKVQKSELVLGFLGLIFFSILVQKNGKMNTLQLRIQILAALQKIEMFSFTFSWVTFGLICIAVSLRVVHHRWWFEDPRLSALKYINTLIRTRSFLQAVLAGVVIVERASLFRFRFVYSGFFVWHFFFYSLFFFRDLYFQTRLRPKIRQKRKKTCSKILRKDNTNQALHIIFDLQA